MELIKLLRPAPTGGPEGVVGSSRGTYWKIGVPVEAADPRYPAALCGPSVVHAYKTEEQAMFFCLGHGYDVTDDMWEAEGNIAVEVPDKVGCRSLTITKRLEWPSWYKNPAKRIRFRTIVGIELLRLECTSPQAQQACDDLIASVEKGLPSGGYKGDLFCGSLKSLYNAIWSLWESYSFDSTAVPRLVSRVRSEELEAVLAKAAKKVEELND